MGDRANIVMAKAKHTFSAPVFFYTHWSGSEIKQVLQSALRRGKERWTDPAYLARIIFCEMVKGDEMNLTGYGISTDIGDGSYPLLLVNTDKQRVEESMSDSQVDAPIAQSWTFDEFCELKLDSEEIEA